MRHIWRLELEAALDELDSLPPHTPATHPARIRLEALVRSRRRRLAILEQLREPEGQEAA